MILETSRLELHQVSVEDLLLLDVDPLSPELFEGKPFTNPFQVLQTGPSPVRYRAPQVRQNPELNIWFIRWIVEKSSNQVVGSISFHSAPDQEGRIEVGLGIADEKQNLGYAKEALLAIWAWALGMPGVKIFRYTVSPHNAASISVIKFFDFDHIGVQIDEEDGPEDIYEMTCETFAKNLPEYRRKLSL
ncbi:MAG: hypothetical protein RIR66_946 [Actinomycetota bacterium]